MRKSNNLFNIIDKFCDYTVLVIGDIILDEYIWGKASRLSPEAPVPVLDVQKYSYIPGGVANVAGNIAALGGKCILTGIIGDDYQAEILSNTLKRTSINFSDIVKDASRPTTVKTRLMAHNHQQLARADREVKSPISSGIEEELFNKINTHIDKVDLLLISDYAKGVLTTNLTKKLINLANLYNKPVLVDPKGLDFTKYTGAKLITPNRLEAEIATKSPSGTAPDILAKRLADQANIQHILVTLGEDGILLSSQGRTQIFPAVTSDVYDVTGAGDSLISALALSLSASGNDIESSVKIGNYAAGVAVRKTGTTSVTAYELKNIIEHDLIDKQEMTSGKGY